MSQLQIAIVCHEQNRAYCAALGDYSQPIWAYTPMWQKSSAINGVAAIARGDVKKPEDSHANWMKLKLEEGWHYGQTKDPEAKTHPCLVPFDELPEDQRVKDILFFNTAKALLSVS